MNQILIRIVALDYVKILIIGVLLCAGYYFTSFQETMNTLDSKLIGLQASLKAEEDKEKDTKETESKAKRVQENVTNLSQSLEIIQKKLPSDITSSDIISYAEKFAKDANIQISQKSPSPAVREDIVEKLPVAINFTATYAQLGLFFLNAARFEAITTIPEYSISRVQSSDNNSTGLVIRMVVNGYRSLDIKDDNPKVKK